MRAATRRPSGLSRGSRNARGVCVMRVTRPPVSTHDTYVSVEMGAAGP